MKFDGAFGHDAKAKELADEQGWKTAQNVATGLVGLVIWPVWFGMDWKGAAAKDAAALQARQQYLTTLAEQRCRDIDRRRRDRDLMCRRLIRRQLGSDPPPSTTVDRRRTTAPSGAANGGQHGGPPTQTRS